MFDIGKNFISESFRKNIEKIYSKNIKWSKILDIEESLGETFDFSLPETNDFWCHSVIYNGILGHQTPKGTGNLFFNICSEAEAGKNSFNLINLPWNVHPDRDEEWFANETRSMSSKDIAQELECSFLGSGDTYIDAKILERIRKDIKPPIERTGFDNNIWVWKWPEKEHKYIISADVARGDGKDFSAFHVFDATTSEVVMEYVGKLPPDKFAIMLAEQGIKYNEALLSPEINNNGYATVQKLVELKYPKIYDRSQKNLSVWAATYSAANMTNSINPIGSLGFTTSGISRNNILVKMEEVLRNDYVKIYSSRFYNELQTFIWLNNNKAEAERGKNDDLIISFSIGAWLFQTVGVDEISIETTQAILDSMTTSKKETSEILPANPALTGHTCVFAPVAGSGGLLNPSLSNIKNIKQHVIHKDWEWLVK